VPAFQVDVLRPYPRKLLVLKKPTRLFRARFHASGSLGSIVKMLRTVLSAERAVPAIHSVLLEISATSTTGSSPTVAEMRRRVVKRG
jgi:hypothetical protein